MTGVGSRARERVAAVVVAGSGEARRAVHSPVPREPVHRYRRARTPVPHRAPSVPRMVSAIAPHVRTAGTNVDEARSLVAAARRVEWRSPTVARYLRALEDLDARLRTTADAVEVAARAAATADRAASAAPVGGLVGGPW